MSDPTPRRTRRDSLAGDPATSFTRRKPTYWLSPGLLLRAGWWALVSGLFGQYQDKREAMGSLPAGDPLDLRREPAQPQAEREEVWFDYVSDTGDGFDATYAVASLVGRSSLAVSGDGAPYDFPRGELLVLGGDECYPRGSMDEYEHRFVGPYRAALPRVEPESAAPRMVVVPGNHDWYDGLTAFTRTFCQGRWIGGWRTTQSRSYFAVSLPGRWWLWAIDIQFDTYVDVVQHQWLQQMATLLQPGDGVILCTAKPAWISTGHDPEAYRTIDFVERTFVEPRGAEVRMVLSGDKHHYSRYEARDGRQLVTAGGGGAYLSSTHHLPGATRVPSPDSAELRAGDPVLFECRSRYPDADTSRRLGSGVFRLPRLTPGLMGLVGGLHGLVAIGMLWMLGAGRPRLPGRLEVAAARSGGLDWSDALGLLFDSVGNILLLVLVLLATCGLTKKLRGVVVGVPHGVLHLLVAITTTWLGARLASALLDGDLWFLALVVILLVVVVVGALVGTELVAASLWAGDRWFGLNGNELFAAQAIPDHKNFLRLHVGRSGELTVYPIGLTAVPRTWFTAGGSHTDGPRIEPEQPMEPHLIEAPFTVWPPGGAG